MHISLLNNVGKLKGFNGFVSLSDKLQLFNKTWNLISYYKSLKLFVGKLKFKK